MNDYELLLILEKKLNKELKNFKEKDLFDLLSTTVLKSLIKTEHQMEGHDCIFNNSAIELKCRQTHYNTLRIEKKKWDHMQQFKDKLYICSTPCGVYMFDLNNIKPEWVETYNPQTTTFNRRRNVLKTTYDIPLTDGENITEKIINKL